MIERLAVRNFYCVKDATLTLSPLHALIGPNDTGKTTLLKAASLIFERPGTQVTPGKLDVYAEFAGGGVVRRQEQRRENSAEIDLESLRARYVRLQPNALRQPSGLVPDDDLVSFSEGLGLPGVLTSIQWRNPTAFADLRKRMLTQFPSLAELSVGARTTTEVELRAVLKSGANVTAAGLSDGILYYLAYLCLQHLAKTDILLIEEPENGLHPSRIKDVVGVLRTISESGTQVVMATHSPLVINELETDEVTLITRTEERGTIATPMRQTRNFEERSKAYSLGELWLSYADGNTETELVP